VGGTVYVKRNEIKDHSLCGLFYFVFRVAKIDCIKFSKFFKATTK
jgi:hypothetical protein